MYVVPYHAEGNYLKFMGAFFFFIIVVTHHNLYLKPSGVLYLLSHRNKTGGIV